MVQLVKQKEVEVEADFVSVLEGPKMTHGTKIQCKKSPRVEGSRIYEFLTMYKKTGDKDSNTTGEVVERTNVS